MCIKNIKSFFSNLFVTKKEIKEEEPVLLGSYNGYEYDYDFLIDTLETCKNEKTFKELCSKYGINDPTGTVKDPNVNDRNKTTYSLMVCLHRILYKYTYFDKEHFIDQIDSEIDNWKDIRKAEFEKDGKLCPSCGLGPYNYHDTGLVDIEYDWYGGGPIGAGVHVSGHGHKEYQFHYKKCEKCGHWEMTEYRTVPSWWDDLWGNKCPFTVGDIIKKYQKGEIGTDKYTSHSIKRW